MNHSSLDVSGSRELIAKLVAEYEAALDSGSTSRFLISRDKLDRWLYPLAKWYLEHSRDEG